MTKASKTEQQLFEALDRLVAGEPRKSDGRITQENIALETGVSRATFNRYPNVVAEYRKVKLRGEFDDSLKPFTVEEKNRELQESNSKLRAQFNSEKLAFARHLASARQEVFILNMTIHECDEKLAEKDREIAELKRKISSLHPNARLGLVSKQ